ncbi:MAG: tetratricopeptide repeat protein [Chloroflexota bacterium]
MKSIKRKQRKPKGNTPLNLEYEFNEHKLQQLRIQLLSLPQDKSAERQRVHILANMAQVYWRIGQGDAAIDTWKQVMHKAETMRDDYLWVISAIGLAAVHRQTAKVDEALEYSWMAYYKAPDNPETMQCLGDTHNRAGNGEEAMKWWLRTLEKNPNSIFTYECIARHYAEQWDYETAETYFQKAIDMDPDSQTVYGGLGNMYLTQGRYKEAVEQYKQLIRTQPGEHLPITNLANCYMRMGKYEKARRTFEKSVKTNRKEALWPNIGLGLLYRRLPEGKGLAKSKAYFERALQIYEKGNAKFHSTMTAHESRYALALAGLGDAQAVAAWQGILDDLKNAGVFDYPLLVDCIHSLKVLADCDEPPPNVDTILAMLEQERQNQYDRMQT